MAKNSLRTERIAPGQTAAGASGTSFLDLLGRGVEGIPLINFPYTGKTILKSIPVVRREAKWRRIWPRKKLRNRREKRIGEAETQRDRRKRIRRKRAGETIRRFQKTANLSSLKGSGSDRFGGRCPPGGWGTASAPGVRICGAAVRTAPPPRRPIDFEDHPPGNRARFRPGLSEDPGRGL